MQRSVQYDVNTGDFFCKMAGTKLPVTLQLGVSSWFPRGWRASRLGWGKRVSLTVVVWGSRTEPAPTQASHPLGCTVMAMKVPSKMGVWYLGDGVGRSKVNKTIRSQDSQGG